MICPHPTSEFRSDFIIPYYCSGSDDLIFNDKCPRNRNAVKTYRNSSAITTLHLRAISVYSHNTSTIPVLVTFVTTPLCPLYFPASSSSQLHFREYHAVRVKPKPSYLSHGMIGTAPSALDSVAYCWCIVISEVSGRDHPRTQAPKLALALALEVSTRTTCPRLSANGGSCVFRDHFLRSACLCVNPFSRSIPRWT